MVDANATRVCVVCGAEFPRNGKQTLCSDVCRSERLRVSQKAKRDALVPMRTCAHCLKEFKGQSNKRYCCGRCKDAARPKLDSDSRKRWNAAWSGKNPDRAREAKRESKRRMREVNGRGDRSAEYDARRARLGIVKWAVNHQARALKVIADICLLSCERERSARKCVSRCDYMPAIKKVGSSDYTLSLKARPEAYAVCLARWRAKSFRRKTGREMPSDGTVSAACLIGKSCIYCNATLTELNRTIDHMTPLVLGGVHSASNIAPCCKSCNSSKAGESFHLYVERLTAVNKARAIKFFERMNGPVQQMGLMLAA